MGAEELEEGSPMVTGAGSVVAVELALEEEIHAGGRLIEHKLLQLPCIEGHGGPGDREKRLRASPLLPRRAARCRLWAPLLPPRASLPRQGCGGHDGSVARSSVVHSGRNDDDIMAAVLGACSRADNCMAAFPLLQWMK
uniref:Uncharacterized protein n=1 Tax=Oryza barthii TaxID=65489 RepID=A0A0D3HTA9_9ORYZ